MEPIGCSFRVGKALLLVLAAAGWLAAQQVHVVPRATAPDAAIPAAATPISAAASPGSSTPSPAPAPPPAPPFGDASIRVNVSRVLVPVTVTDPMDRLVTGLEAGDFRIYEDKIAQRIKSFSSDDAPVSVGVIFDASGSMSDKIAKSREALSEFFKTANPQDEFFLVDFNDQPRVLSQFTTNLDAIQNAVTMLQAGGRTALLDAVYLGLSMMRRAHNARKALLIISDGGDNHSRYTESEIRNYVKETDVQIYCIGIFSSPGDRATPEEMAGPTLLTDISEVTGGREFGVDDVDELPDIAEKIGIELRNEYVIGYEPSNLQRDGKWRKIRVKLSPPPGLPPLTVNAKAGYYAPSH
jgi:Ca-activated chloride channel family protein